MRINYEMNFTSPKNKSWNERALCWPIEKTYHEEEEAEVRVSEAAEARGCLSLVCLRALRGIHKSPRERMDGRKGQGIKTFRPQTDRHSPLMRGKHLTFTLKNERVMRLHSRRENVRGKNVNK